MVAFRSFDSEPIQEVHASAESRIRQTVVNQMSDSRSLQNAGRTPASRLSVLTSNGGVLMWTPRTPVRYDSQGPEGVNPDGQWVAGSTRTPVKSAPTKFETTIFGADQCRSGAAAPLPMNLDGVKPL